MLFFGSSEEARNYSCKISIKDKFGREFNYSGPVHALDKSKKAVNSLIVNSGSSLALTKKDIELTNKQINLLIGSNAAKLTDKENTFQIEVTIQNLKSEAISSESQDFYQTKVGDSPYLYQTDSDMNLDSDSSLDSDGHQN